MEHEQDPALRGPKVTFAALSDTGRSRSSNQDYAYAGEVPGAPGWTLLAVADGLGGHARGEWASQRAVEVLVSSLGEMLAAGDPAEALREVLQGANDALHVEGQAMGAAGAATTLVLALIRGRQAWWANVGDSRLYRWHSGTLTQVSEDHSWVGEAVRSGRLPKSALKEHPEKNVVTRTIGFESVVLPDVGGPIVLRDGDRLLLCSDGLHGPVSDEILGRCVGELEPEHAVRRLVDLANEAGGPDNITVVVGQIQARSVVAARTELIEVSAPNRPPGRRRKRRVFLWSGLLVATTGAVAAAIPAALVFLN
ncbi:MAG: protein phosphatase 2C domain-containing protein [bacterium]